jgi:hypothetical protein
VTRHPDPDVLAEYREGLLGRRHSARIQAHLAGCPHCASVEAGLADVSALLASAPAPDMPADLVTRLDSTLAAEAAARSQAAGADPAGAGNGAAKPVPDGATAQPDQPGSSRRNGHGWWPGRRPAGVGGPARRRPAVLGAAAAAVIVLAGAGYGLASLSQQPGGVSASSAGSGNSSAGGSAGSGGAQNVPAASPATPGIGPHIIHSGIDYQPGTLARQAKAALTSHFGMNSGLARGAASSASQQAAAPQQGCVMRITAGRGARLVDMARYQGRPATIIVQAPSAGHPGQVWVAGPACSAQHSDILAHTSLPSSG